MGAPIDDALLALLPLVGVWEGVGAGLDAGTGEQFSFGQRVTFGHDGRGFLAYRARAWLLDAGGGAGAPAFREAGFWRPGTGPYDIEAQLVSIEGAACSFVGRAEHLRWEIATDAVLTAPTAAPLAGGRRLYAIVDEALCYATERAVVAGQYQPHLNAALRRVPIRVGPDARNQART